MVAMHLIEVLLKADAILRARYLLEASVHLPRRGTRWMATFRDETGSQVWKATGLTDRNAVQAIADELEAQVKRKRAARGGQQRERPQSGITKPGQLTQREVALILGISERGVRAIEKRAFEKLRKHPALKALWREWNPSTVDEAAVPATGAGLLTGVWPINDV